MWQSGQTLPNFPPLLITLSPKSGESAGAISLFIYPIYNPASPVQQGPEWLAAIGNIITTN